MYIKPQVEDSMVGTDSSEGTQTKRCRVATDSAEIVPRSSSLTLKGTQTKRCRVVSDSGEMLPWSPTLKITQKISS